MFNRRGALKYFVKFTTKHRRWKKFLGMLQAQVWAKLGEGLHYWSFPLNFVKFLCFDCALEVRPFQRTNTISDQCSLSRSSGNIKTPDIFWIFKGIWNGLIYLWWLFKIHQLLKKNSLICTNTWQILRPPPPPLHVNVVNVWV